MQNERFPGWEHHAYMMQCYQRDRQQIENKILAQKSRRQKIENNILVENLRRQRLENRARELALIERARAVGFSPVTFNKCA